MMKVSKILVPAMLVGLLAANAAVAKPNSPAKPPAPTPTWTDITPASGSTFAVGSMSVTYGASSLASAVWYYNDNLTPQNADSIQGQIEKLFSLSGSNLLTFVSSCNDTTGTTCTSASLGSSLAGTTYTYSSTGGSFDYLGVHLGGGELVFQWTKPVKEFTIEGLSKLSDFRAYTNVSAVPEPETYAMMLAGLLGIVGLRRRKLAA